jgi:hypothetical protein
MTGLLSFGEGLVALWTAIRSPTSPDIATLYVVGAGILLLAGLLTVLRVRRDDAQTLFAALTGGSFAIGLVDLSLKPLDEAGRYGSLMPTLFPAACLLFFLLLRGAYELGPVRSSALERLDQWLKARRVAKSHTVLDVGAINRQKPPSPPV